MKEDHFLITRIARARPSGGPKGKANPIQKASSIGRRATASTAPARRPRHRSHPVTTSSPQRPKNATSSGTVVRMPMRSNGPPPYVGNPRTGEVWTFLGFPTYGGGPFERIGIRTTVPLLVAFLGLCGLEVVTGWLLWRGRRAGAVLAVALLPIELAFWIGFALPFGPPLGLARAILVTRMRSSFMRPSS